jgi:hypothetical protein
MLAPAEESSAESCLDTTSSEQSKSIPTVSKSSRKGKRTGSSRPSPSLLMSTHSSVQDLPLFIAALRTSSLLAFPARLRVWPGSETQAMLGIFGPKPLKQSTSSAPGTHSLKMSQVCSLSNALAELESTGAYAMQLSLITSSVMYSQGFPQSGMTASGRVYPRQTLEHRTSALDSGSWLTPGVEDAGRQGSKEAWEQYQNDGRTTQARLRNQVKQWPTPTSTQARSEGMIGQMRAIVDSGQITIEEAEAMISGSLTPSRMRTWHTPSGFGHGNGPSGNELGNQVNRSMWPTPNADDANNATRDSGQFQSLTREVRNWPTPASTDWKGAGATGTMRDRLDYATERGATKSNVYANQHPGRTSESAKTQGSLDPAFVEYLMGFPSEWLSSAPWATLRCRCRQQQHSSCCFHHWLETNRRML